MRLLSGKWFRQAAIAAACLGPLAFQPAIAERIKDLASIQGVRNNQLIGYGIVVGLDTGFTHFAAALARPTVGIFCDSDSVQAAVFGDAYCASFGQKGMPPDYVTVLQATSQALDAAGQ